MSAYCWFRDAIRNLETCVFKRFENIRGKIKRVAE
jgi:hypothetical protein